MKERCQIVLNAKELAKKKGLDKERVSCPAEYVCNGSGCIYVADSLPKQREKQQIDKFQEE